MQNNDKKAKALRSDVVDFPKSWEDDKEVSEYQSLSYVQEIICFKVISCLHDNLLAYHFRIDKIR